MRDEFELVGSDAQVDQMPRQRTMFSRGNHGEGEVPIEAGERAQTRSGGASSCRAPCAEPALAFGPSSGSPGSASTAPFSTSLSREEVQARRESAPVSGSIKRNMGGSIRTVSDIGRGADGGRTVSERVDALCADLSFRPLPAATRARTTGWAKNIVHWVGENDLSVDTAMRRATDLGVLLANVLEVGSQVDAMGGA